VRQHVSQDLLGRGGPQANLYLKIGIRNPVEVTACQMRAATAR
jgi:hypothetical protein